MSFSGWIIGALAVLVAAYWTPALIKNRNEVIETPVEDRFSTDLKLVPLAKEQPGLVVRGEVGRNQPRILPHVAVCGPERRVQAVEAESIGGFSMADLQRISGEFVSSTSRQMAKLRASRAARVAKENAAGKRRFAVFAVALTLLVAFVVAATFSTFSWWFLLVPAAVMGAVLAEGRLAYRRSIEKARAETELLKQLREERRLEQSRYNRLRSSVEQRIAATAPASESVAPSASSVQESVDEEQVAAAAEPAEWTPRELPAPAYARAAKAPRRRVVVDPSVLENNGEGVASAESSEENRSETQTVSPLRPVVAKPRSLDAMTSEEAAEMAETAFDLEDILEFRRAQ